MSNQVNALTSIELFAELINSTSICAETLSFGLTPFMLGNYTASLYIYPVNGNSVTEDDMVSAHECLSQVYDLRSVSFFTEDSENIGILWSEKVYTDIDTLSEVEIYQFDNIKR